MMVYHGGLAEVPRPEIRPGKYVGDFGIGFYVTSSLEQARRFVKVKAGREGKTAGFVSSYELDERQLSAQLKGLTFAGPTREWAEFVLANRLRPGFAHDYDYVRGPVANDQVYASFALFEGGLISFAELVERLQARRLCDQILFHTEAALALLAFAHSEPVQWKK